MERFHIKIFKIVLGWKLTLWSSYFLDKTLNKYLDQLFAKKITVGKTQWVCLITAKCI
jgi:hypothetical protein